ncbi:sugar kinase [Streptomyces johnsoniae]|uniref:Sugar kinase n=1 Tax=Streptomyces johnsoniae TaxID=3075532 RepID=A0ABU2S0Y6_9ACTN|nr:sugar kinase [Streptomyces sp. DSM 41886]MDT0442663.1 sugar kinase [Streptomyces sp. DSM 41886]
MVATYAIPPEVVCLGETMAQVTPLPGGRIDGRSELVLRPGGAESNVAMALVALGHRAAWASRVGADPLGDLLLTALDEAGVDLRLVERDPRLPTGVYFKDPAPAGSSVYYYRAGSAAAAMDRTAVGPVVAAGPRVVHLSGITPVLAPGCRDLVEHLMLQRPVAGAMVSFDVNHRPALWDRDAGPELLRLARAADVVFVGLDEAARLWPVSDAADVRELIGAPVCLVVKQGAEEAVCFDGDTVVREPAPAVAVVEPVGAGDAFAAGWLAGLLRGLDHGARLRLGHLAAGAALESISDQGTLPPTEEICRRIGVPPARWRAGAAADGEG